MVETTYRPGRWLGIVRSGSVIVMEAGTDPSTVDQLWEYLGRDTPTIHGVLNAVTSHFGPDLTGMPQFGILVATDRLHVILRGGLSLAVETAGVPDTVSGRDVTTWSERSLALPDSLVLTLDGETPGAPGLPLLPLGEAVVMLSALRRAVPGLTAAARGDDDSRGAEPADTEPADTEPAATGCADGAREEPGLGDPSDGGITWDQDQDPDPDQDAYAGFAMAADAEWTAELAGPLDTDLGQTIYPPLGHDDAEPDLAQPGPADADDGEAEDAPRSEDGTGAGAGDLEQAEAGNTSDYDHLFGATELRSVEDAAIRLDENGQEIAKDAQFPANIPPQPSMPPAAGQPATGPAPVLEGDAAPAWQPPSGFLIDSVPWGNAGNAGMTSGGGEGAVENAEDTDHDGHTVMRSEFGGSGAVPGAAPLEPRPPTGPMVLARLCPAGHANPPSRSQCSDCGAAITSEPREVGRPRLGRMHISTGEVLDLDHSLVVGRQPSVSRVMGGVMPRLVQVHSASGDISRSHVEVRLDGWDVLLVDLKATNGTVLVREGQAPRRLGQGELAILLNGDIAELGDGVSLLFEGLL